MKITNKSLLPQAMVHAVTHDRYDPGDGDISCTGLIGPAQIRRLNEVHGGETTEDASDRIWSLMGSAVHYIIENATTDMKKQGLWHKDSISERRFYAEMDGKKISGQIDIFETDDHGMAELSDFKLTSVWSVKDALTKDGKADWDAQLNIQRWLMHMNGIDVKNLFIVAMARDWNKSGSMRDPDYPPKVAKIEIPMWTLQKTEGYIQSRLNAHFGKHIPQCTPDECWEKPTMYALKKKGRQSALRVLPDEKLIMPYAADKGVATQDPDDGHWELKKDHYIEVRLGERNRCLGYCEVAPFCEQYKDWKKHVESQQVSEQES